MQEITVTIKWDKPDEPYWLNADNIKTALSSYCKNTSFEVEAERESKSAVPSNEELEAAYRKGQDSILAGLPKLYSF